MRKSPDLTQAYALETPEDSQKLYADWADTYEADVAAYGYATPARIARALAPHLPDTSAPILDFGCGTGLSGQALAAAGFTTIDGTDISAEMRAQAWRHPKLLSLQEITVSPNEGFRHFLPKLQSKWWQISMRVVLRSTNWPKSLGRGLILCLWI